MSFLLEEFNLRFPHVNKSIPDRDREEECRENMLVVVFITRAPDRPKESSGVAEGAKSGMIFTEGNRKASTKSAAGTLF